MLSDVDLKKIIENKIKQDEELGDQVGGSGHSGYVDYELNEILEPIKKTLKGIQVLEVTYKYTLLVTTEFTYYPDNPPYKEQYIKTIFLDMAGKVIDETEKN